MQEDEEQADEAREAGHERQLGGIAGGRPENAELLAEFGTLGSEGFHGQKG